MIAYSDDTNFKSKIEDSYRRISAQWNRELQEIAMNTPLIISDNHYASQIYSNPIFQKAYEGGFGALKGNMIHNGSQSHLIVLNKDLIMKVTLTDEEFDGVFSHELGHVFNRNPPAIMPSIMSGNTLAEIREAKDRELLRAEFFADYFATKSSCQKGLISSIGKYLSMQIAENKEMFIERLKKLESAERFEGEVLQLRNQ